MCSGLSGERRRVGTRDPRCAPRGAMMAADHVRILDGNTFLVTDENGDVETSPNFPTGLFSLDTRFLSTWRLSINGERLHALSVDEVEYFQSRFFLVPGAPTQYLDAKVSVIR